MPIKYEEARLVLLILAAAGGEHAILVGALVLVLLGARVQGHERRSGVVAQLGEILDVRPVLRDIDEGLSGQYQKLGVQYFSPASRQVACAACISEGL